jgi:thiol-disulfide isomerase/thioredoxin
MMKFYAGVRTPEELHTLTLLSAIENRPLITLWTAPWCNSCATVAPIVKGLLEERVGLQQGGLGYVEVDMSSTLIGDLPVTYRVGWDARIGEDSQC